MGKYKLFLIKKDYIMEPAREPNFKTKFYEDVGDPLAGFRKQYRGGALDKKGKEAFAKDPDVLQAEREEKLKKDEYNNRGY